MEKRLQTHYLLKIEALLHPSVVKNLGSHWSMTDQLHTHKFRGSFDLFSDSFPAKIWGSNISLELSPGVKKQNLNNHKTLSQCLLTGHSLLRRKVILQIHAIFATPPLTFVYFIAPLVTYCTNNFWFTFCHCSLPHANLLCLLLSASRKSSQES